MARSEIWLAASCDFATTEMKYPRDKTTIRKRVELMKNTLQLPRKGTPNHKMPNTAHRQVSSIPITK